MAAAINPLPAIGFCKHQDDGGAKEKAPQPPLPPSAAQKWNRWYKLSRRFQNLLREKEDCKYYFCFALVGQPLLFKKKIKKCRAKHI